MVLSTEHQGITRIPCLQPALTPIRPALGSGPVLGVGRGLVRWGQRKSRAQRRNKKWAVDVMLVANPSCPKAFFPSSKARCLALLGSWKWAEPVIRPKQAELVSWDSLTSSSPRDLHKLYSRSTIWRYGEHPVKVMLCSILHGDFVNHTADPKNGQDSRSRESLKMLGDLKGHQKYSFLFLVFRDLVHFPPSQSEGKRYH